MIGAVQANHMGQIAYFFCDPVAIMFVIGGLNDIKTDLLMSRFEDGEYLAVKV